MADTKITKKPSKTVTSLGAPKREGNKMTATWKVPSSLVDSKKNDRATALHVYWSLGIPGKDPKKLVSKQNEKATSSSINLNDLKIGSKKYTRDSFYPHTKRKLSYVTVKVVPVNSKGDGPEASETRKFKSPRVPSLSKISFDGKNGRLSCTIETNAGDDYHERDRTDYKVIVKNTHTSKKEKTVTDTHSTSTKFTTSYDAQNYMALAADEYIKVTVQAWAKGFAGKSKKAEEKYYLAYPKPVIIKGVDVTSKDSTGKCIVRIDTNTTTSHPVDGVRLRYLANVNYAKAKDIPGDASWSDSDIVDNAKCTALSTPVSDLLPDPGKHTWICVKSWRGDESRLFTYSQFHRIDELETMAPTAEDDDIEVLAAVAGGDGESIEVQLGWNADGEDDSTGTELSWADAENAWRSTEEPDTYGFTWSDGPLTAISPKTGLETTYNDSAKLTIKGLEKGVKYFISARRYLEGDDKTTYSKYADKKDCFTSETPDAVVATCDGYLPEGNALDVRWVFTGNGLQRSWQIVKLKEQNGEYVEDGLIIEGLNAAGSTRIEASAIADKAENGVLVFRVDVSTGGDPVESNVCAVNIIDPPTLELDAPARLETQTPTGYTFDVRSSVECDLIIIVTSSGAVGQFPDGIHRQTEDDTIYSDVITPQWTSDGDDFISSVELPSGLDFWDRGEYTLSVTAVDRSTGLRSDETQNSFDVLWEHQAVDPIDATDITPIDEITEEGYHRQGVRINLMPAEGMDENDVYDIYRVQSGRSELIGEGFPQIFTTIDEYAPFGDDQTLTYRIAVRTPDGDVEFAELEYELPGNVLRFDWAGGTLELPYDIELSDGYKKDAEIRNHMDGSVAGYWNPNIERTGSLQTNVIRLKQQEDIEKADELARYAGPVFVRTPIGSAYTADVQVHDMSVKEYSLMAIAIDTTEIDLTDEFRLQTPFEAEEEEES